VSRVEEFNLPGRRSEGKKEGFTTEAKRRLIHHRGTEDTEKDKRRRKRG
jgi:hypothetical protein